MKAIELFAGAGGLGMGVSLAGFQAVQIVERDRWCCDTIRENRKARVAPIAQWPEPTFEDIKRERFEGWKGTIELVSGGPPCQPFSLGGKHRAHDDDRDMWSEAVRVVRETRPKAFLFENVKGLTRASFLNYFSYIKLQLEYPDLQRRKAEGWYEHLGRLEQHHLAGGEQGLRYRVVAEVLNAANYGVPQRRERVVFVGFRTDMNVHWRFPAATHSQDALLWEQCRNWRYWERHGIPVAARMIEERLEDRGLRLKEKPQLLPWRTVRDAIGDLPEPDDWPSDAVKNHRLQAGARSYKGHTGSPLDEAAKTLKAGVHGVPGGENMLSRLDGSVRYFTVRESARLQTFPDDYVLHGSWSEAMRQLGNAVPVELARVIANDVAKHLRAAAERKSDSAVRVGQ